MALEQPDNNINEEQEENVKQQLKVEQPKQQQQVEQPKQQQQVEEGEVEQKVKPQKRNYTGVKTTLFTNPNDGTKHAIPVAMSPMPTINRILTYTNRTGFCGILCIGMSGTGKSTLARFLVHHLHKMKNFTIHWYERDDIQKLDKIITSLTRGTDHIVVMDDASFSLEQLKKEEITKIAQKLTYIRHDVKGQVIVIMNIHYSKAISRFFRNVPFAFLTSITQEEAHTFQDVWPHGRWKFKDFAWYYQQMMFNSKWTFEVDRWENKTMTYRTDDPFRLGLAMEGNYIHFFVYLKDGCNICDPQHDFKQMVNSKELVDYFVKSYGLNRARSMLKLYAFSKHGKKCIDTNRYAIWRSISEFDKNNKINWDNVITQLNKTMKNRRRSYIKKAVLKADAKQLDDMPKGDPEVERIRTEQEVEFQQQLEEQLADLEKNQDKVIPMGYDPESQNPIDMPVANEDYTTKQPTTNDTEPDQP